MVISLVPILIVGTIILAAMRKISWLAAILIVMDILIFLSGPVAINTR